MASTNVEIVAAAERGAGVVARSGVLAAICATRRCLAVAGTKGKTTTASMLSLILIEAGLRPSFLIGADVNEVGTNAVWDSGEWLVVEADESFGTFQALRPDWAVLTNVESDHLDHYGTFARLRAAFDNSWPRRASGRWSRRTMSKRPPWGGITDRGASARLRRRFHHDRPLLEQEFGLLHPPRSRGRAGGPLTLGVPGLHNARNAALALVTALQVGVPFAAGAAALARLPGVTRRFEFRGEAHGVTFVDDYAHLPFAVRATLATARTGGWSRVIAVFQPHRYSRTAELAEQFGRAFLDADELVVTDVYGAGEPPVPGVSGRLVADAVQAQDPRLPVVYVPNWEELRGVVGSMLRPGDLCLTLGAGDLTALPDELLESPGW